jgi:hypothetical protein
MVFLVKIFSGSENYLNSNSKIRSTKQIQNPNSQILETWTVRQSRLLKFPRSDLFRISAFGFRIWLRRCLAGRFPKLVVLCIVPLVVTPSTGCKSSDSGKIPPTQSGHPEVTMRASTASDVKVAIREFFTNRGYVEKDSRATNEMVFDKPAKSGRSGKALRVLLRFRKETNDSWRLIGIPLGVDGWRSDLESEVVVPQGASQIQALLAEIKNRVESGQ